MLISGADPGFPVGGGANHPGGRQHTKLPNFPKNCMKYSGRGGGGGGAPPAPPKSANGYIGNMIEYVHKYLLKFQIKSWKSNF